LQRTIIIADGLTNEFLSPEVQFRGRAVNLGTHEIARLMGAGPRFGAGALPRFVEQAAAQAPQAAGPALLGLRDVDGGASADGLGSGGSDFVEAFHASVRHARVLRCARGAVPFEAFSGAVEALGAGLPPRRGDRRRTRFLLVGCHTDKRIFVTATFLRGVLGFRDVAVCSHLVGSPVREAHVAALVHGLPSSGVRVFLDLGQAARFAGLDPAPLAGLGCRPCTILPARARRALGRERRSIIEFLCMHWTRAELKPLQGGYTGSLLFLANGWKGASRTEPMVLKVDRYEQMRRELEGYRAVKDLLGKNVPTFTYPVTLGDSTGVGMELAAMEGRPETLQDCFESAEGDESVARFMRRLQKALDLLVDKLYHNTRVVSLVAPYRRCELHTQQQIDWLLENAGLIVEYAAQAGSPEMPMPVAGIGNMLRLTAGNEDGIESETCLAHGDLNLKNVICDDADNVWFIDWTHSDLHPVELDFAKVENDVKFVMSRQFAPDDLSRLRRFEEYLLEHREPVEASRLPETLAFVRWDLRFRKILDAVRRIRVACFSLKADRDDWLVYRIALLRYALHTLSFDERRGLGECGTIQLLHALFSVEGLLFILAADDFHLKIRGEKPPAYPPRLRVLIDEAPWDVPCQGYAPPYHVDPAVLRSEHADPENIVSAPVGTDAERRDAEGRPLNPRGRTGIGGRGALELWGANRMVGAVVTRVGPETSGLEVLLGKRRDGEGVALPVEIVRRAESESEAFERMFATLLGGVAPVAQDVISQGYAYDLRQTDHAWVELLAHLYHVASSAEPASPPPGLDEVEWWPVSPDTINQLPPNQSLLVRESLRRLSARGIVDEALALAVLANTG
jgi:ADP-ribose pyrophosphatase